MHEGKRFPAATGDFLGTVRGRWSVVFASLSSKLPVQFERGWKSALRHIHSEMNLVFSLPKTFAKYMYMQRESLAHQQRTGRTKPLLSVYIAKQFWGQQQQPAFCKTTREISRRQRLTFRASTRRTLRLSPTELHSLSLMVPPISLAPPFVFALNQPDVIGMGITSGSN